MIAVKIEDERFPSLFADSVLRPLSIGGWSSDKKQLLNQLELCKRNAFNSKAVVNLADRLMENQAQALHAISVLNEYVDSINVFLGSLNDARSFEDLSKAVKSTGMPIDDEESASNLMKAIEEHFPRKSGSVTVVIS